MNSKIPRREKSCGLCLYGLGLSQYDIFQFAVFFFANCMIPFPSVADSIVTAGITLALSVHLLVSV